MRDYLTVIGVSVLLLAAWCLAISLAFAAKWGDE